MLPTRPRPTAICTCGKLRVASHDLSHRTLNKKVREAQVSQYNLIFVVGEKEQASGSVCIRLRDAERTVTLTLDDTIAKMRRLVDSYEEFVFEPRPGAAEEVA